MPTAHLEPCPLAALHLPIGSRRYRTLELVLPDLRSLALVEGDSPQSRLDGLCVHLLHAASMGRLECLSVAASAGNGDFALAMQPRSVVRSLQNLEIRMRVTHVDAGYSRLSSLKKLTVFPPCPLAWASSSIAFKFRYRAGGVSSDRRCSFDRGQSRRKPEEFCIPAEPSSHRSQPHRHLLQGHEAGDTGTFAGHDLQSHRSRY